jgi:1-acyl-sn-glycerol-3-phosphate acyltransferase
MYKMLRHLHRIYFLFIILIFSILFYPLYFLASRRPKWYDTLNKLRVYHSKVCSLMAGVRFRYQFETSIDTNQHYVFCANHTSSLDIMILCILAHGKFHFMGKEELKDNPVLKIFFNTIDIAVDRNSKMSAFRAFKRAAENLDKGMSLLIFPEGGIHNDHYPPKLMEFKNGPFRLAIEKRVPILPISIINAWELSWDDGAKYGSRPGICDIYVHKPIFTNNLELKADESLKSLVFNKIQSKILSK